MRARLLASLAPLGSLAPLVAVLASAAPARADTVSATRYEIVERSHVIDMRVDRGVATLVVQRTVENRGPKSDQATFFLDLPPAAVATRLRTAGVGPGGERIWFEGELMEAEAAAKKYRELTGIGGYYPKDPALLSWRSEGLLALQVFPVPGQSTKTVEYTLKLPLEYSDGTYHVELPVTGTDDRKAEVRLSAAHPEDALTVNGVRAPVAPAAVTASRSLTIELVPRGAPRLDAAIASVPIEGDKHLVRATIAAAPRLEEAPRGAHVVVLFDNSRSMKNPDVALAALRAYLGHMSGAVVEFLAFDREVRAPIGRSLPVAQALSRLSALSLTPRNGSHVDDALARADAILAASPHLGAARRVVLVTDTLTRGAISADTVGKMGWKSGAVLHVATVEPGTAKLERDDDSPWATLPRRTGGLFWGAHADHVVDAGAREAFEEWARPKRIDKLEVRGLSGGFAAPDALNEGQGLDHFVIADAPTTRVELSGELWSRPVSASFAPTAAQGKLAAALVFGSGLYGSLSEPQQMKLAMLGGAVSPVTSYLAIEPGVRPSNEGLDWEGGGLGFGGGSGALGGIGLGTIGTLGHGAGVDKEEWLRRTLLAAARKCGAGAGATSASLSASLESTRDEIVDVVSVELSPARDAKAEACVRDELWEATLPGTFTAEHEDHTVSVKL